jgi:F-type H+-transporting ATPase subunit gamma
MKSIENINEITKAMQMIATFRYKKAEGRFTRSKGYFCEMEKLVANLSAAARHQSVGGQAPHVGGDPLFIERDVKKKALVVMTGDKGLCGAYNTNLIKAAQRWIKENAAYEPALVPVAKVGNEFFKKRQTRLLQSFPEKSSADFKLAKRITDDLVALYLSGAVDSVELLYTDYRAGGSGSPVVVPFVNLRYLAAKGDNKEAGLPANVSVAGVDYIYEPGFGEVFTSLLGKYLEGKMYVALLESLTSEYSARMVAMKQATENGEEVLHDLKLLRNKTRQATITRELSEIVSGASILV